MRAVGATNVFPLTSVLHGVAQATQPPAPSRKPL